MDADLFLQQFWHLAQGKDGIKKLRDVILQLAVQGKLVEQNPADEPAEALLKKIEAEKKRLVKEGKVKKRRAKSFSENQDIPYILPSKWVWVQLEIIATLITDGSHNPPPKQPNGIPMLSGQNIKKGQINFEASRFITEDNYIHEIKRTPIEPGDVFLSIVGTIGESAVVPESFPRVALQRSIALIKTLVNPEYLSKVFSSPVAFSYYNKYAKGTAQKGIYLGKLSEFPVPLPPLAEQKRIVAKVDALMALCDRLEAEQTAQRTLKMQAVQSTLHHLRQAENPTGFDTSLNILENSFGNWFDDLANVKHLRATILQLAVQGKLVPQKPTDEPAEKLVSRVNKKKHQFKPIETPFSLPHGWMWASFPQLGEFGRGKSKHRPRNDPRLYSGGKHPFVQTGDVSRARDYIRTYSATYNDEGLAQSKMWPTGTMCITIAANIAETAILAFDACFPDSVVGFIADKEIGDARYFEYFLRTAKTRIEDFAPATAQKNINLGILEKVAIPLPPLAEQKRIVAKVDALMALCDQLEANITQRQTSNTHLMDSLIHLMTQAA